MSLPQNGRDMDRPSTAGGSVKRARERLEAGLQREGAKPAAQPTTMNPFSDMSRRLVGGPTAGQSKPSKPPVPAALQGKDGQIGVAISRPTQVPQWPLPGPIPQPASSSEAEGYRPPPGKSQPPQRPPRPSRVPSILDNSRVQDHTPVFQYTPQNSRDSEPDAASSMPPTPSSRQTVSSVGSIPDFPIPLAPPAAAAPVRRSVNLGPPPSARRGASSFYSNVSFVSPIPEESPRSRSHTSLASSAAMPESWGTPSPGMSPRDPFYDRGIMEEGRDSIYDDEVDDSKLVRSASIGKLGKPSIVMNRGIGAESSRPAPMPVQRDPFADGTGYVEASSSSSGALPTIKTTASPPATADAIMDSLAAASATDPSDPRRMTPSPRPYSRLSAIRRPPKLDMDAVNGKGESRASITSLPDLIRRATRLAAMIDIGRRPASRFEDFEYPDEKAGGRDSERYSMADDRHQSGLSDMLAAFPPPAQATRQSRVGSWFRQSTSWPLPAVRQQTPQAVAAGARGGTDSPATPKSGASSVKRGRRCCGLPLWGFIVLVIVIIGIIAAAVLVPLEFFVFRNLNGRGPFAEQALAQCQAQLTCSNGGTNVISQDVCSCICTNGFTGSNCNVAGAAGCTTTNLVTMDDTPNINNVTLGQAIPRLIADAQTNFSIPLSGTAILARFNTASLSCVAQNSLVTFQGRSMRVGAGNSRVLEGEFPNDAAVRLAAFVSVPALTVIGAEATLSINAGFVVSTIFATTRTFVTTFEPTPTGTTTTTVFTTLPGPTPPPNPTATFVVTEEVLDFARVAMLLILQQDGLQDASTAQSVLQRFFTNSGPAIGRGSTVSTQDQARNITLGNGNSVDLINFRVDVGTGAIGGRVVRRSLDTGQPSAWKRHVHPHGSPRF